MSAPSDPLAAIGGGVLRLRGRWWRGGEWRGNMKGERGEKGGKGKGRV